jgi:N-acetyl-1-D-myo-inositol-2-amino-2-deoxy-alpha-D-glucopyranoside deacetylase
MSEPRTLLVLHAHPDDEVFRTAGIFAKYAAEGARVVAVYATRGEAGEMHDPDLDPEEATARLGEIREGEVRRALHILGVTDLRFLGYRDSGMKDSEHNAHPDAFINAPLDKAAGRLVAIMRETRPQVIVCYDEDGEGGYGHPDHVMVNRVAVRAFELAQGNPWAPQKLYYGARSREGFKRWVEGLRSAGLQIPWMRDDFNLDEYGVPDSEISTPIDISPWVRLKKPALAAHRSQIPADFFYLNIPDEALEQYAGVEYYQRIVPPAGPGERENDLFAGTSAASEAA